MGSFLFLGPSGVGKTLLSKALAEFMFGDEDALVQVDMSEYMEKHNVSRLIGAPPGYVGYEEGGQLTERIRRRPYSVVLLDEIEKAHPDVFNMLLQIMEEGRLTDSFGRHVDFRNVVMIMTSNIGSELIKGGGPSFGLRPKGKGEETERNYQQIKDTVMKELERYMRPEFIGRLDDVIVFRPLGRPQLEQIVEYELRKVTRRLVEHGLKVELDNQAKEFLIEKGTNADFGARPLRRAIEQHVEDPLSEEILRGEFKGKDTIRITVKTEEDGNKHLYFESLKSTAEKPEEKPVAQASSDAT
jgi:ATP-dependent Clp protease ATP-binding subunit ClpC